MGGVDLNDMRLALYRIKLGTKKWYMHVVYYALGVCIVNGWLLYRRHCHQNEATTKSIVRLKDFKMQIAYSLMLRGKSNAPKRGRPSFSIEKPKTNASVALPQKDIRLDRHSHFPNIEFKQNGCRHYTSGYTKIRCLKCNIYLFYSR